MKYNKHETAIVPNDAYIRDDTCISEYVIIRDNAVIGKNCHIDAWSVSNF